MELLFYIANIEIPFNYTKFCKTALNKSNTTFNEKAMEEKKRNWGGARAGAGRKSISKGQLETIGLTVEAATKEKMQRLAKAEGISMSEFVNRLVKEL